MSAYVVVERGSLRLLGDWWTPVCEVAQNEANVRGGIVVAASFFAKRTGVDPVRALPSFGRVVDNNRPPKPASLQQTRTIIRDYENCRFTSRRVA